VATTITFVSTNRGKLAEVREVLKPYGVRVRWRSRTLPEPQVDTLEEVVRSKLSAVHDVPGPVLVEDSGLFIDSLNGFPGVYSAHFLRLWGFGPILELLKQRNRAASFRAVVGLRSGSRTTLFEGEVRGSIARRPRGNGGFGYDPIFVPAGWTKTFAQVPPSAKNELSHRARAFRQVGERLRRAVRRT
jgi:XTP/dITP diphosphohydrolase